jgi:predicted alpha/beta-hydrolase family hydrolase
MLKLQFDGPQEARLRLALAHGAGAGMNSPYMARIAAELGARGVRVARFDFPYMQKRSRSGKAPPDRAPVLLDTWRAVVAELGDAARLVIGGKSMGGRIASMVADELGVAGLICLGYPFHPPGRPETLRTVHLKDLKTRSLIVQGTRDEFGTRDEVETYDLSKRIAVRWIEDGDHSLTPRRKLGHDPAAARELTLRTVLKFLERSARGRS